MADRGCSRRRRQRRVAAGDHPDLTHRTQHRQRRRHRGVSLPGPHPLGGRIRPRTDLEPARDADARHRRGGATVHVPRGSGGGPGSAGSRLRRRFLRRDQGGHRCRASVRPRVGGSCATARDRTARLAPNRRAHHDGCVGCRRGRAHRDRTHPEAACHRHRRCARFGGRRVGVGSPRRARRLPSAVHVGFHPRPGRRGDHPQSGRHQLDADDPVDRPSRPKHARLQLVTALPRYGSFDDRVSHRLRRPFDPDVAFGVHPPTRALDPRAVCRVTDGPRRHRRTELRLRVRRATRITRRR